MTDGGSQSGGPLGAEARSRTVTTAPPTRAPRTSASLSSPASANATLAIATASTPIVSVRFRPFQSSRRWSSARGTLPKLAIRKIGAHSCASSLVPAPKTGSANTGERKYTAAESSRPHATDSDTAVPTCSRVRTRAWTTRAPKPSNVRIDASMGSISTITAWPYSAGEIRRARTTVAASPSTSATTREMPTQRAPESAPAFRPSRSSWSPRASSPACPNGRCGGAIVSAARRERERRLPAEQCAQARFGRLG